MITSKICIKEESNRVSFVREHVSQQDEIELRIFSNENELNGITNALGYPREPMEASEDFMSVGAN